MTAQILAAVIFVGMFALIIMDKFERQYVTLGSAALVLVVVFGICMHSWDAIKNALNLGAIFRADFWYGASESASSGVNWSTIFFITGMMIMVEGLGKSGFFRWLCLSLAKLAHYHVVPLLLCFMAMAAFLAMCRSAVSAGVYRTLEELTVDSDKGPLLSEWAGFYKALCRELTYQRNVKLGRPCAVPSDRDAGIVQTVTAAVNAENPLEGERLLLDLEFRRLDGMIGLHNFDDHALYGYAMKLQLLERQRTFRYESGKRAFDGLMQNIRQQVSSL